MDVARRGCAALSAAASIIHMNASAAPGRCVSCARPGPDWHGAGPWIIVHGLDTGSVRVAHDVAEDCRAHGVEPVLSSINEVTTGWLFTYTGLVLVLPVEPDVDVDPALAAFVKVFSIFRARRMYGLGQFPEQRWNHLGIVQWVGPRGLLDNRTLRTVLTESDARHLIEDGRTNVFDPYGPSCLLRHQELAPVGTLPPSQEATVERVLRLLAPWGITAKNVPIVKEHLDGARNIFEDPRYPQLYRPIAGLTKNRLDIILDGPSDDELGNRIGNRKAWMENGARACGMAIDYVQQHFPDFDRPANRRGKRGLQRELHTLYRNLRGAQSYFSLRRGKSNRSD